MFYIASAERKESHLTTGFIGKSKLDRCWLSINSVEEADLLNELLSFLVLAAVEVDLVASVPFGGMILEECSDQADWKAKVALSQV